MSGVPDMTSTFPNPDTGNPEIARNGRCAHNFVLKWWRWAIHHYRWWWGIWINNIRTILVRSGSHNTG
jgi:hypothetical protein